MKKILLIGAATFAAFMLFKPEFASAQTGDPNEGQIVIAPNGNVWVIKDGKRWAATSESAVVDYLAAYPSVSPGAISLSESQVSVYPIAGALYEKLNFRPD